MGDIQLWRAAARDLDQVTDLFDAYRVYYGQPADKQRARRFLEARIQAGESVILLAGRESQAVGFTQLYPSFSSVSTAPVWILNDLYVDAGARRCGVASALLQAASEHAVKTGAAYLTLETLPDNRAAQALYQKLGWVRDGTRHYVLRVSANEARTPGPG